MKHNKLDHSFGWWLDGRLQRKQLVNHYLLCTLWMHTRSTRQEPVCERLEDRIPSFPGDLDVDHRLHPWICVESRFRKGLRRFGTPIGGNDHAYLVCDYHLPTRFVDTPTTWSLPAYALGRITLMVMQGGNNPRWNYQPPCWLFPTHFPPSLQWRLEYYVRANWRWLPLIYSSRYILTLSRK